MHIAIVYWGLNRSLKYTLPSIQKNIFTPLQNANISYDSYMHTYKVKNYENFRTGEKGDLDFEQYKLLQPNYFKYDDQDEIIQKLDLSSYYGKRDFWNNNFQTTDFFILALYSKYLATKMVKKNIIKKKKIYHAILFIRTDVQFLNPLNTSWIVKVAKESNIGMVPDFHHWKGLNDRMFLSGIKIGLKYGLAFKQLKKYILEFKKYLHSEKYNKWYLEKCKSNIVKIPFFFQRIRLNGKIHKLDYKLFKNKK